MASDADIRISDTERHEAVSTLGLHMSTGRLELAEYEERCGRAAAARTRGELEALFEDLPAPHPDLSSATRPTNLVRKTGQLTSLPTGKRKLDTPASKAFEAIGGLSFMIGIPAAILLTIFSGAWWLFIVVPMVAMVCGAISDSLKKPNPEV